MPNWCSNNARISGPAPVIAEIKEILKSDDPALLNWMVPQPKFEGDQDWYNWNVANWGSKWDISDVYINNESDEDDIEFSFSSAWSPPVDAFKTWAERDGRVTFELDYYEPGMGFLGTSGYDGEHFDEEVIDSNSDPEGYRAVAVDKWGEEFEEEEEPFTEWYLQGVEDIKKASE
jgi:Ferredoxin-like domain in Api92-like protein